MESLKPGEWFRAGEFSPELCAKTRDQLRRVREGGLAAGAIKLIHNHEGNLLVVCLPKR